MTKYKAEEQRNDVTTFLSFWFCSPSLVLTMSWFSLNSKERNTDVPPRVVQLQGLLCSASPHRIQNGREVGASTQIFLPLAFLKTCLPSQELLESPVWLPTRLTGLTTLNKTSPDVCACAEVHQGMRGSRRNLKQKDKKKQKKQDKT